MVQLFLRNVWKDLKLPMSALATVTRKRFKGKFTAKKKKDFSLGYFMVRKSKVSPYTILFIFGPHAGEILTKSYGGNYTK